MAIASCRIRSSVASQRASSGRDDSVRSNGRRNSSISASGGSGPGGGSDGLSSGASVAVTAPGERFAAPCGRRDIHQAPAAMSSTINAPTIAIGLSGGPPSLDGVSCSSGSFSRSRSSIMSVIVGYGAPGGGTRRLVACSNAYASSISRGSLHAVPVKLTPYGAGCSVNPGGYGFGGGAGAPVGDGAGPGGGGAGTNSPNGTITVGYPGFAAMPALPGPGKTSASSLCALSAASMPSVPPRRMSLSRSACHLARSFSRSNASDRSRLACAYLIALRLPCAVLNARRSASVLTGAAGPSDASQSLKSLFMPYHSTDEQFGSLGPLLHPPPQSRKLFFGSWFTTLGMSASTMVAPSFFMISIASAIDLACGSFKPPRGSFSPGSVMRS